MKLIDKAAVVAEIDRSYNQEIQWMKRQGYTEYHQGLRDGYANILSFLNTLEVKEVDLEKEIRMFSMNLAMKENNGDWEKDIAVTAKHFFEFGIKAQKGK